MKLSPEFLVAGLIKSATNGRIASVRLRRIITLIIIPVWIAGIAISIDGFITALDASTKYKEYEWKLKRFNQSVRPDGYIYDNSFNQLKDDYQSEMWKYERKKDGYFYILYFLLICLIIPWVLTRIIFWIIDADKATE